MRDIINDVQIMPLKRITQIIGKANVYLDRRINWMNYQFVRRSEEWKATSKADKYMDQIILMEELRDEITNKLNQVDELLGGK